MTALQPIILSSTPAVSSGLGPDQSNPPCRAALQPVVPSLSFGTLPPLRPDLNDPPCPAHPSRPALLEKCKLLGRGAFGVVWLVRNRENQEMGALKEIKKAFTSVKACVRGLREVRIMTEFSHDNLIHALAVRPLPPNARTNCSIEVVGDLMWTSLESVIGSEASLGVTSIRVYLYQILRGLKFLHSAGIVHGDVKPGNLLVHRHLQLKIGDFGFASAVDPVSGLAKVEGYTLVYSPPEVLAGERQYGPSADMWAVGCVLFELISRSMLFVTESRWTQLDMITDLIGSPGESEVQHISDPVVRSNLLSEEKPCQLWRPFGVLRNATDAAVALVGGMLRFDAGERISATDGLDHVYLVPARAYYHGNLCSCCSRWKHSNSRLYGNMEPRSFKTFHNRRERKMTTLRKAQSVLVGYVTSTSKRAAEEWK